MTSQSPLFILSMVSSEGDGSNGSNGSAPSATGNITNQNDPLAKYQRCVYITPYPVSRRVGTFPPVSVTALFKNITVKLHGCL